MKYILLILLIAFAPASFGQSKSRKKETDTLLIKLLKYIPEEEQSRYRRQYKRMSSEQKKLSATMMDFFANMAQSSKKQLIQNVDTNYAQIAALKEFYSKIVPSEFAVYVEFKPPDKILQTDESIDLWVYKKSSAGQYEVVFQEWNVELKSKTLDSLLQLTPLTRDNLKDLKFYLDKAHCISISNRDGCEIGYARSGMGKYSYLIFDNPLNEEERAKYNDGCTYIFYKDNIVLEYGGGAIGSQCFPDSE